MAFCPNRATVSSPDVVSDRIPRIASVGHSSSIWAATLPAWREECEEESGGSGGPEAGYLTAPAMGEWRGV
jgi:hypothetical protein